MKTIEEILQAFRDKIGPISDMMTIPNGEENSTIYYYCNDSGDYWSIHIDNLEITHEHTGKIKVEQYWADWLTQDEIKALLIEAFDLVTPELLEKVDQKRLKKIADLEEELSVLKGNN